jgi:sulfoxide reductase heme-binding subunit YedZ
MTIPTQVGSMQRLCIGSDPIRRAIYVLGMVPAATNFYLGVTDQLGADPQKSLELRFLILSLSITPLRRLGGPNLVRYRRALGLLAFYYAALHLTVYTVLDQGLDLAAIGADIVKRPYITVGMLAFVIIVPLAATSNAPMIRRLGGARWQRLHRFVYAAAAAAAVHFVMVVKSWSAEPLIYAGVVAALLLFRLGTRFNKGAVRARPPRRATDGAAIPRGLADARASLDPATP